MSEIAEQYQDQRGEDYHNAVNKVSKDVFPWISKLRKDKLQSYISENDSVLEYGIGTGWNLSELVCRNKYGFDVSKHLKTEVENLGISFIGDIDSVEDSSFDVVICHHVIEHVENPAQILKEIYRLLKPSGKMLLFVPSEKSRKYNKFDTKEPNMHLFSWNVQTLGKLVEFMGFDIAIAKRQIFGYDRFAAVLTKKLYGNETTYRVIRRLMHFVKTDYEAFILANK